MELYLKVDINIFFAILLASVFSIAKTRLDKKIRLNKVFLCTCIVIIIQLLAESATFIIDHTNFYWLRIVAYILHTVLFIDGAVATYLWFLFIKKWTMPVATPLHKKWYLLIPLLLNFFVTILSPFTGWIYRLSSANVYQRGPLFFVPVVVCYFYLLYSIIELLKNRKDIMQAIYRPMMIFALIPATAGVVQVAFYGTLLMWSSAAFSLTMVFIFLQQRMMQFDTLTGAWTKSSFEHYIEHKVNKEKKQENFGVIFIDLDNFKKINDTFGHLEGDIALKTSVHLIKTCLMRNDIIARFGGDEFVVLAQNCGGNSIIDRINLMKYHFAKYNETSGKNYQLKFSCGYAIYDAQKGNIWQFLNHVDHLMYQNKEKNQFIVLNQKKEQTTI